MINQEIYKKLEEKYAVQKENHDGQTEIILYPKNSDGSPNQDAGYKLTNDDQNQIWILNKIERDRIFELGQFKGDTSGLLSLWAAVEGQMNPLQAKDEVKQSLRNIESDIKEGKEILEKQVNLSYFSIEKEKAGAVNLMADSNKYHVIYLSPLGDRVSITKSRPLNSALVVVYNFSMLLEKFDQLFKNWNVSIPNEEVEKLKRVFIGK
ncbi:hypothetical protein [Bacillus sp. SJS]|uniref:hypothetical protein n=1 Tax=Bacillus sp. SJS TaxID=1423321 RepID=UPI0004DD7D36|nr:hypothetical protein [Bacillus sp. SJS]KZZ84992.1 hypothetical protein AS29_008035 [Bacillus sp. SJS]